MEKLVRLELCQFKREETGRWELGLMLNDGALSILDEYGQLVDNVWESTSTGFLDIEIGSLFDGARRYFNIQD